MASRWIIVLSLFLWGVGPVFSAGPFELKINEAGIGSLRCSGDRFPTDYIAPGRNLGDAVIHYRWPQEKWKQARTDRLSETRILKQCGGPGPLLYEALYEIRPAGGPAFSLRVRFRLQGESLAWELELQNLGDRPLEIGDIALPLAMNSGYGENAREIFEQKVIKHHFISGYGSFLYWIRPNGLGPLLLMLPDEDTSLEFFELTDQVRDVAQDFYVYIHSAVKGGLEKRGTWRQPHTGLTLLPRGSSGERKRYGFTFRWASDFEEVHELLFRQGFADVRLVPGMSVPQDLTAQIALRSRLPGIEIRPEFPAQTTIEFLGEKEKNARIYKVRFSRLGENILQLRDRRARTMNLEFFVTQPLETLIRKRAAFLVRRQQHRDPAKWYNGLFSQWDMRSGVLRGPDNTDGFDGWWGYVLACDDPGLCKAPFLAAKNLSYPDPQEIAAIEYYIENFVWGKLQRSDRETPYPYGIYGVPNWYENRNSPWGFDSNGKGQEHLFRMYDYPHLIMLYFHMYQIASLYPQQVHYLDRAGYLERAWQTARAFFEYPYRILPWYEIYKWGCYNELLLVDLMEALRREGRQRDADWLQAEWEKKVKYFIYDDPYPFRSEYSFDTTAFESSHAFARYAVDHGLAPDRNLWYDRNQKRWYSHPLVRPEDGRLFMEKQIQANLACRGVIEPCYYYLGSDYRGESGRYTLSYMSQMGGWALLDYALHYATDPFSCLRLGYASFLSSWALMNTGTPESHYGYWYPGQANDGASGWAFESRKYGPIWIRKEQGRGAWFYDGEIDLGYGGALRSAATVVAEDPLFGWIAYGGELQQAGREFRVLPRDGLRQRFFWLSRGGQRFQVLLQRDGFAAERPLQVSADLGCFRFVLENRDNTSHQTLLRLQGLGEGVYRVTAGGNFLTTLRMEKGREAILQLPVAGSELAVRIEKQ